MPDYSGPQSKFLIGKLLLQFLTYFLINFVSKKTHSKSYLCPIHLSLFLTSMKSSNCPYFKLAHATQQYCFKTQNQGYCSVWRNLDSFSFWKRCHYTSERKNDTLNSLWSCYKIDRIPCCPTILQNRCNVENGQRNPKNIEFYKYIKVKSTAVYKIPSEKIFVMEIL